MTRFRDHAIFDGILHRIERTPVGYTLRLPDDPASTSEKPELIGPRPPIISVRGRVIASTRTQLAERLKKLESLIRAPPLVGRLEAPDGRRWDGMAFIRIEPGRTIDAGRTLSQSFCATFAQVETTSEVPGSESP